MAEVKDIGEGPPLVLVPTLNGPWQYLGPAIDALAKRFRVVAFSLTADARNGRSHVADDADCVGTVLDSRGIDRAIVCGVSYGGVVATRFAASHPSRTQALVIASSPGAGWHLKARHEVYARWPWVFGPAFFAESPFRVRPELAAAFPALRDRLGFVRWQLETVMRAPFSLSAMAARAIALGSHDIVADCRQVTAPTLVVTGAAELDRVVPAASTATYAQSIAGARSLVLERTGHFGTITRPEAFATAVETFVRECGMSVASASSRTSRSEVA
jgi:pimeloyl-ACP methyl ester carboxylesterase